MLNLSGSLTLPKMLFRLIAAGVAVIAFSTSGCLATFSSIGDSCQATPGIKGICRPKNDCKTELLKEMGRRPVYCGHNWLKPLLCCPITDDYNGGSEVREMLKPGDSCQATPDIKGTCRLVYYCKLEALLLMKTGRKPALCGYKGLHALICCPTMKGSNKGLEVRQGDEPGDKAKRHCDEYKRLCPNSAPPPSTSTTFAPSWEVNVIGTGRVVQGKDAKEGEFPHMAAIGYGEFEDITWQCGGSLISENFVLTAAHCLSDQEGRAPTYVRLGARVIEDARRGYSSLAAEGQTRRVLERIKHPEYTKTQKYNDVALLKIEEIPMGGGGGGGPQTPPSGIIRPACLHYEGDFDLSEGKAVATGWGMLEYGGPYSANLMKVSLSVLDNSVCNKSFEVEIRTRKYLQKGLDSTMICVGDLIGRRDTCTGDSGGPLQIQYHEGTCLSQLIGITSFGKPCGFKGSPSVYTKVKNFVPWIESVVWP